jgi:sulfite exporter TauE/SafE/copper chaperone CopZ
MQQTYTFHVNGMHCKACVVLTESQLKELPQISSAKSSLHSQTVQVTGEFGNDNPEQIATALSTVLIPHGYSLSVEKIKKINTWSDFKFALPIALFFALIFVILQKIGLVNLIGGGNVTLGTAFVVGVIASLSSCMAVVGGLLLSMSATFAKSGDLPKPLLLFHIGRVVAFFTLGGVIGEIGKAFQLSSASSFVLSLLIGLIMLTMGINLLDVFHWSKKIQPSMPKFISQHTLNLSKFNHSLMPLLVGVLTFFLPCGFTQSMQIYTLSTGNFLTGGLTMLTFALGTLPVLALISFSSFSIKEGLKKRIFFKTAGLVVIMFALFNLINSLVAIGIIRPLFNF